MSPDLVDAHVHFWRRADLPWLNGPMVPRIFGDYEALRRDYPVGEYVADAVPAGVRAAVYVQANWPLERAVEEVEWLASLHDEHGWPHAVIASADQRATLELTLEDRARAIVEHVRRGDDRVRPAVLLVL